jgi:hypothetical protein
MRRTRPAALVAVALSLAALASACGGGGDDDTGDVATLGDTGAATDDTTAEGETASDAPTDPQEAALAYAECMRENGIDMPDPEFSNGGGVAIAIGGEEGEVDEEALQAAQEVCQPIMENARPSEEDMPSDEEIQEMQDRALEAAQCMRDHGYDWPDPVFEDGGRMTQMIGGEDSDLPDPDDPEFQAAQEECMGGAGGVFTGGGPGGESGDGPSVESGDGPSVESGGDVVVDGGGE